MEQELGPFGFFRIHRNYLVNVDAVFSVNRDTVTLVDYSVLPLSKDRKQRIKDCCSQGGEGMDAIWVEFLGDLYSSPLSVGLITYLFGRKYRGIRGYGAAARRWPSITGSSSF